MEKIKLVTDSASDISAEDEKKYGIRVMSLKLAIGDKSYTSRVDFNNEQFYKMLEESETLPVTSQVTPFEFAALFEECYRDEYTDVIYVAINSVGSATYWGAEMAAREFFEDHPEAKGKFNIYNIDSGLYSGTYGYAVVEAAKMIAGGSSVQETVAFVRDWCENAAVCFGPFTLKYAAKSGRIPVITAHMGNLLNIKPIMRLYNHEFATVRKVRSVKNVLEAIRETVLAEMIPNSPYSVIYGSDMEARVDMASQMAQALGYPPAAAFQVGEAIAINVGPRLVGVVYRKTKA